MFECAFCFAPLPGRLALVNLQPCCVACWPHEGDPCAECGRPLTKREEYAGDICTRCWFRGGPHPVRRHTTRRWKGLTHAEQALLHKWAQVLVCGRVYR